MKLIRIDQDVWKVLTANAIPLQDTPNSVLRRLLDIEGRRQGRKRRKRLSRGSGRTDQTAFLRPILEILKEERGEAEANKVLSRLERKMASRLKPIDFEKLRSGQVRWRNTAQWARNELAADGLLEKDTPRGVWKISRKGQDFLKEEMGNGIRVS